MDAGVSSVEGSLEDLRACQRPAGRGPLYRFTSISDDWGVRRTLTSMLGSSERFQNKLTANWRISSVSIPLPTLPGAGCSAQKRF